MGEASGHPVASASLLRSGSVEGVQLEHLTAEQAKPLLRWQDVANDTDLIQSFPSSDRIIPSHNERITN
jgi:hypothetical protein